MQKNTYIKKKINITNYFLKVHIYLHKYLEKKAGIIQSTLIIALTSRKEERLKAVVKRNPSITRTVC